MNALVTLVALLLKNLSGEDLAVVLGECADLFMQVARSESGVAALALVLRYITSAADVSREELGEIISRALGPAIQEAYMTTEEMIHKEGYDRGLEQGLERGLEQGLEQGRQSMLLMLLEERFGPLPTAVEKRVRAATPAQLEAWSRAVLRAPTLDEVFAA